MIKCPCGLKKDYPTCCGRFIDGNHLPESPEELMRSRYTAYTRGEIDYIEATMRGPAAKDFDKETAREWATNADWLSLQVLEAPPIKPTDTLAHVEFVAQLRIDGREQRMHERSEFQRIDGKWYYTGGEQNIPMKKSKDVGRNDPCPCGSGKKFKRCCW